MAAEHGEADPKTSNDQKVKSVVIFRTYTDPSRWGRDHTFDEYHRKDGNDVGRIVEFDFKTFRVGVETFRPSSDNLLADIVLTVLSPPPPAFEGSSPQSRQSACR